MRNILILLLLFAGQAHLNAQHGSQENTKVLQVIEQVFEGMRSGDSAMVHASFLEDAQLFTALVNKEGKSILHKGSLKEFLNAVGSPHDLIWNEHIWNTEVKIDGNLAQIWTDYAFYAGDKFSHCGVDAFHLFKSEAGWKIFHLTDTRRAEGCDIPAHIKEQYK